MDYKEYLQSEMVQVLEDLKKIKFMHCNEDAIKEKRLSCEIRLNVIRNELESIRIQDGMNARPRVG